MLSSDPIHRSKAGAAPAVVSLAAALDAVLPQTQCRRCGYDGCRPYAEAMAAGAPVNRCPPGGDTVIATLAMLTARPVTSLDPSCGASGPLNVARIDEAACIGCTLCIQACPVDAIIGAPKRMHTVLSALCTGCELCVPPCPVDCIAMGAAGRGWSPEDARAARSRFDARNRRLAIDRRTDDDAGAASSPSPPGSADDGRAERQARVAAALDRARARRAGHTPVPRSAR
jgi:Na+-translocating ferredoxin:NAD+ oxidoreductase subunit B